MANESAECGTVEKIYFRSLARGSHTESEAALSRARIPDERSVRWRSRKKKERNHLLDEFCRWIYVSEMTNFILY